MGCAAANFFCVTEGRVLHTPSLGSILPGVTRDSVIQLARRTSDMQLNVGKIPYETALKATEAFVSGTGAGLTPLAHISSGDERVDLPCPGPVTKHFKKLLEDIQFERSS